MNPLDVPPSLLAHSASASPPSGAFGFDNSYAQLPAHFYSRIDPTPVAKPRLIKLNTLLAQSLRLDPAALMSDQGAEIFSGNRIADGSDPIALAYAGHQFGHFVPQLGDGRANLLGEVIGIDGLRYDIQLKGSGPTPFSRRGDGRAALGPVLREYIVSEAMAALGVPTARALAAVTTGESVIRDTVQPGAIFTRVAASHIRVGTFQYFAAQGDIDSTRILADYTIARHYPDARQSAKPYRTLLDSVIARQASLIAQWMLLGFVHGVMNTDNMAISGETIDYGPCAFMEAFDPAMVFSSIDHQGRYAYGNQPRAALWNLTRLAETLLPLMEQEEGSKELALASATEALTAFEPQFEAAHLAGLRRKLGLLSERNGDADLALGLLNAMTRGHADFTLTFHHLADAALDPRADQAVRALFADPMLYDRWAVEWRDRIHHESASAAERAATMRNSNPLFIPRNHLVEEAIVAAVRDQNFQPFESLLTVTANPYENQADLSPSNLARYTAPATSDNLVTATFCGT